jgi:hypothetical protein
MVKMLNGFLMLEKKLQPSSVSDFLVRSEAEDSKIDLYTDGVIDYCAYKHNTILGSKDDKDIVFVNENNLLFKTAPDGEISMCNEHILVNEDGKDDLFEDKKTTGSVVASGWLEVNVGDVVFFQRHSGISVTTDKGNFKVFKKHNIIGILC